MLCLSHKNEDEATLQQHSVTVGRLAVAGKGISVQNDKTSTQISMSSRDVENEEIQISLSVPSIEVDKEQGSSNIG